jgi:hypothetical protein
MLQAGPNTSAFVVTPVSDNAAAEVAGAADAAAGALVAVVLDGLAEVPQAASATVTAAIAPTLASR